MTFTSLLHGPLHAHDLFINVHEFFIHLVGIGLHVYLVLELIMLEEGLGPAGEHIQSKLCAGDEQ